MAKDIVGFQERGRKNLSINAEWSFRNGRDEESDTC